MIVIAHFIFLKSSPWSQTGYVRTKSVLKGNKIMFSYTAVSVRKGTVLTSCGISSRIACNETIPGTYIHGVYVHPKILTVSCALERAQTNTCSDGGAAPARRIFLLYSVSVPCIIECKYWSWMRPPAPAGGPRLVCPPAQSGRLASVSYTLRGVSTCK